MRWRQTHPVPKPGRIKTVIEWVQRSVRAGSAGAQGQGWGIPPQDPHQMLAQRLQGFATLIRNNMRYYGAMRLDHVMALFRLWWVAAGFSAY